MNQVLSLWTHPGRYFKLCPNDFLVLDKDIFIFERQKPAKTCKKNNSTAPNIALIAFVLLSLKHFRSSVTRATTSCL